MIDKPDKRPAPFGFHDQGFPIEHVTAVSGFPDDFLKTNPYAFHCIAKRGRTIESELKIRYNELTPKGAGQNWGGKTVNDNRKQEEKNDALFVAAHINNHTTGLSVVSSDAEPGRKKPASIEAMRVLSLLEGRPIYEGDIAREDLGRPFFPDRRADFSIAHSGTLVAVSHVAGGNLRTGCDIERVHPRAGAEGIAAKFFSAKEREYIFWGDGFDDARFYVIWTLKECFLKLRGLSVFDMGAVPSFIGDDGFCGGAFAASGSLPLAFRLYELSGGTGERYILATVVEGAAPVAAEIQWLCQSVLDCKMIAEIRAAPSPVETVKPKR